MMTDKSFLLCLSFWRSPSALLKSRRRTSSTNRSALPMASVASAPLRCWASASRRDRAARPKDMSSIPKLDDCADAAAEFGKPFSRLKLMRGLDLSPHQDHNFVITIKSGCAKKARRCAQFLFLVFTGQQLNRKKVDREKVCNIFDRGETVLKIGGKY